ncbi:MAG TPA: succinate dehydrogenase, cytochrome b556 subunit [Acetobacteraceae bacterium]|nr:succinate dehydrogenase, cytochrome b556 subunit [Acetobacteraceae bacterium]
MSVANRPVRRPLSPHLQIYRWQLTSVMSILHRATGIALSVGALYLAVWVMCAAAGPRAYAVFQDFNTSILGRLVLGGWLFSGFYHLCNGIRHLFWDAGYGFELKDAYRSGWIVVAVSLLATVLSWIVGLRLV